MPTLSSQTNPCIKTRMGKQKRGILHACCAALFRPNEERKKLPHWVSEWDRGPSDAKHFLFTELSRSSSDTLIPKRCQLSQSWSRGQLLLIWEEHSMHSRIIIIMLLAQHQRTIVLYQLLFSYALFCYARTDRTFIYADQVHMKQIDERAAT